MFFARPRTFLLLALVASAGLGFFQNQLDPYFVDVLTRIGINIMVDTLATIAPETRHDHSGASEARSRIRSVRRGCRGELAGRARRRWDWPWAGRWPWRVCCR